MNKLQTFALSAYDHLNAISPAIVWLLLTVAVFLVIYCMRRFAPKQWLRLEDKLGDNRIAQALPATLVGAVVSAVASGGDVGQSWKGALAGALAPLLHHALKAYNGADAVLDAAQAKLLTPETAQPGAVTSAVKAAVLENVPVLVQAIKAADPITLPAVPSAVPTPEPTVTIPVTIVDTPAPIAVAVPPVPPQPAPVTPTPVTTPDSPAAIAAAATVVAQ